MNEKEIKSTTEGITKYGFARVAAVCPRVKPGDVDFNTGEIKAMARQAALQGAEVIVTPELSLTGYTCGDLFTQQLLLDAARSKLDELAEATAILPGAPVLIAGVPVARGNRLYNCAAVLCAGRIEAFVPKTYIPDYNEFYEKRRFTSGAELAAYDDSECSDGTPLCSNPVIFETMSGLRFGVEICEDLWVPDPPSTRLTRGGADIIFNLSASPETIGKHRYLRQLLASHSGSCRCGYVYASAGAGESSTDLSFSGNCIVAADGRIIAEGERFSRNPQCVAADIDIAQLRHDRMVYNSYGDHNVEAVAQVTTRRIWKNPVLLPQATEAGQMQWENNRRLLLCKPEKHPFVPEDREHLEENCREITAIQSWGLEQRLAATGCRRLVVGISGGLDSTLALLIACRAFDRLGLDRKGIIGITMPGEATSDRTHSNAWRLMGRLGVDRREIPIGKAVAQHFNDIGQDPRKHDAAYENSQARERTQILMDTANKEGAMVLGTGDLSELALGWCTYNGDHMSMYGVNASVPKTLVSHLVRWYASGTDAETAAILTDIADTPISPELIPSEEEEIGQKTEDLIGPYELHDFYLYHTLRYGSEPAKIYFLALQAFDGVYDLATIKKWLVSFYRRFFSQQFKRSCMPDGVKVGSVCLSPRGDWRMPSDASVNLWLKSAESLPD